jgi:hypothetical protein
MSECVSNNHEGTFYYLNVYHRAKNAVLNVRTDQRGYTSINCSVSMAVSICASLHPLTSPFSCPIALGGHSGDHARDKAVGLGNSSPTLRRVCFTPPLLSDTPTACHISGH